MTALRKEDIYITPADYLAGERLSDTRHEYLAGVVHAMSGGTAGHARIGGNIYAELRTQLRGRPCEAFGSDMKVRIRAGEAEFYYYPDVSVDCSGNPDPRRVFLEEPTLIVEVLSPATERIDLSEKFTNYLRIPSLQAYLLVGQYTPHVTVHRRVDNDWRTEFIGEMSATIALPEIGCELPLTAIYERMGFGV